MMNRFAPSTTWNDASTGTGLFYVIEYSPGTVIPEPSSLALVAGAATALAVFRRRK
jgi:hypothetical protein